jgi:DNA-binding transcriptional ArsR family regulator
MSMSTERFNRQFILLDFKDLDNPEYLAFVRAPEFSTYLLMRRNVWRSAQPHHMGLEALYRAGFLTCSLDREKMAEQLGGVSIRTVSNDLAALEKRGVITVRSTGRQNIYLLGRWGKDEGVYYETFYVDRLHAREEETFPSDAQQPETPVRGEETFPSAVRQNFPSEWQIPAALNKERKGDINRDDFEPSKNRHLVEVIEARAVLTSYVQDLAREFRDEAPLTSSVTRAVNLYAASELDLDDFVTVMMGARRTTQERTASIKKGAAKGGPLAGKNKMPYFFEVLADLLNLAPTDDDISIVSNRRRRARG